MKPFVSLTLIEASEVFRYLEIGLNVAFYAVLAVLILSFLWGLIHGWRYGTYHFLFLGILVAVAFLTLSPIGDMVAKADMSSLASQLGMTELTFDMAGQTISVPITSLKETLTALFTEIIEANGASASAADIAAYASALAISVVKLLLLIVEAILIAVVGSFLAWVLWHIAFKWFLNPKVKVNSYDANDELIVRKVKRKRRLRLVSAFEQLVISGVIFAMMIMPLTALVNTVNNNLNLDEEQAAQNEYVSLAYDVLDAYDNSIFAQVYFNWTRDDGEQTFDSKFLSFVTSTKVDEIETDIITELSSIAGLGEEIVNSGLLSAVGTDGMRWSFLLATSLVPNLLRSVTDVDLVQVALPVAASIALNLPELKELLGDDTIEYLTSQSYDWTEELENLASIYDDLLLSGFFDVVVDEVSMTPSFNLAQIASIFSSEETYEAFTSALSKGDRDLVNHLLAGVMFTMAENAEGESDSPFALKMFLQPDADAPLDYELISSIQWFDELSIVYETIYEFVNIDKEAMDDVFDDLPTIGIGSKQNRRNAASSEGEGESSSILDNAIVSGLLNIVIDHPEEVGEVLVGSRDASGEPTGVDEDGITSSGSLNLLDSALIGNALDDLLPALESSIPEDYGEIDLSEAQGELVGEEIGDTRVNFKREFGAILDIAAELASTEEGKAFLKDPASQSGINYDPDGSLNSIDEGLLDSLISACEGIDRSRILTSALPGVLESAIPEEQLEEFGLVVPLDYHAEDIGHEAAKLLSIARECPLLLANLSSFSTLDSSSLSRLFTLAQDEVRYLLDTFINSKVLNPISEGVANQNFCGLVNNLLSLAGEDVAFESLTPEMLEDIPELTSTWENGEITRQGETYFLVKALISVLNSGLLDRIDGVTGGDLSSLSGLDIESVFSAIGDSAIMSHLGAGLLDSYILEPLSIGQGEGQIDLNISFHNITDWDKEGAAFQAIIDLASSGLDLANLDLTQMGPELSELLCDLASSGIFTDGEEYLFPEYLYNKLLLSLSDADLAYFLDPGIDNPDLSSLQAKQNASKWLHFDMVESLPDAEDWIGEDGEAYALTSVLSSFASVGGISALSDFSFSRVDWLREIVGELCLSKSLGRVVPYNAIDDGISSFASSSALPIDFSAVDASYFLHDEDGDLSTINPMRQTASIDDYADNAVEADRLFEVVGFLVDPTYGLVDEGGYFKEGALNIGAISSDYLVRPLLYGAADSILLTSCASGARASVLDQLLETLLLESDLYGVDDVYTQVSEYGDISISDIVASIPDAELEQEIERLCVLLDLVQSSSFVDASGNLDLSAISDPASYFSFDAEEKKSEMESILSAFNSSSLLYRALPGLLDDALFDDNGNPSFSLGSLDPSILSSVDPYFTFDAAEDDLLPYPEEEITNLVDILSSVGSLSSFDSSDLSSLDPTSVSSTMAKMMHSGLFNSKVDEQDGLTSFQKMVAELLKSDAISEYLYLEESPKDQAASYSNAEVKADWIVKESFPLIYSDELLSTQDSLLQGEGSLEDVLSLFHSEDISRLLQGGQFDFDSLEPGAFVSLLTALNDSPLLFDLVPNIIYKTINSQSFAVEGIDLSKANPFFSYYQYSAYNPDFDARFDETEIYQLSAILSTLSSSSSSLGDLSDLSALDPLLFRGMLIDMENSYVFHMAGLPQGSEQEGAHLDYEGNFAYSDLTVFEQLMFKVYDESGLASLNYSLQSDAATYLLYDSSAYGDEEAKTIGYKFKLHDRIASFEQSGSWLDEIKSLTIDMSYQGGQYVESGLLNYLLDSSFVDDSGRFNFSASSIKSLPPDELRELFSSVNELSLCGDLLPNVLTDLLSDVGLDRFSSISPEGGIAIELSETAQNLGEKYGTYFDSGHPLTIEMESSDLDEVASKLLLTTEVGGVSIDLTPLLSSLLALNEDSGKVELDLSPIPGSISIGSSSPLSASLLSYDTTSYRFTQQGLKEKDTDLLCDLLESVYIEGDDPSTAEVVEEGYYFDFNAASSSSSGADVLLRFQEAGLKSGAILSFFQQSNIFSNKIDPDFETSGSAFASIPESDYAYSRDYALYNLFAVTSSFELEDLSGILPGGSVISFPEVHLLDKLLPVEERSVPSALLSTHAALGEEGDYANLSADSLYLDEHLYDLVAIEGFVSVLSQFEDLVPENPAINHNQLVARTVIQAVSSTASQLVEFSGAFSAFDYSGFAEGEENKPAVLGDVLAGEMDAVLRAFKGTYVYDYPVLPTSEGNPRRDYLPFNIDSEFPDAYSPSNLQSVYESEAQSAFRASLCFLGANEGIAVEGYDPYAEYAKLDLLSGDLHNEAALLYFATVYDSLRNPPDYHYFDFTSNNGNVDIGLSEQGVPFSFARVAELSKSGIL